MAMSVVAQFEFEQELLKLGLSNPSKESHPQIEEVKGVPPNKEDLAKVELIERGRPLGKTEVPQSVREFIATESLSGTPAKELTELLDISPSSISAYKVGATSTSSYHKPDPPLDNHVKKLKIAIATKARGKLLEAIDSLTSDKISNAKAKDISSIAKDMAAVVRHLDDKEGDESNKPQVQFVFFAPKVKDESSFPIIEVAD
jgi:hypothetical protein